MPISDQELQDTLLKISASILSIQKQLDELKHSPALNGAFDQICKEVTEQHAAIHRIEEMLISPSTGDGLVMRVKELEGDNDTRKEFMSATVLPSLERFQKMRFQMESFDPALKKITSLEEEVSSLKLKQAISSKVAWGGILTALGLAVSKLMTLLMSGTP